MRKVAKTDVPGAEFLRAMIYDPADGCGVWLFLFRSFDDGPCDADFWYEDVAGAERHAGHALGTATLTWQQLPDPRPGCQHDWIATVRCVNAAGGLSVFEHLPE